MTDTGFESARLKPSMREAWSAMERRPPPLLAPSMEVSSICATPMLEGLSSMVEEVEKVSAGPLERGWWYLVLSRDWTVPCTMGQPSSKRVTGTVPV
eukprot:evm.model.NODE_8766_length_20533_cov_18.981249.3